jgi:hypothetical protein
MFGRPGVSDPANRAIARRVALNRRKGAHNRQQEVDRLMRIQQVAPLKAAVTALSDSPCGQRPSTGKERGAGGDLSSDCKQFNANVNGLALRPRPPFCFAVPCCRDSAANSS